MEWWLESLQMKAPRALNSRQGRLQARQLSHHRGVPEIQRACSLRSRRRKGDLQRDTCHAAITAPSIDAASRTHSQHKQSKHIQQSQWSRSAARRNTMASSEACLVSPLVSIGVAQAKRSFLLRKLREAASFRAAFFSPLFATHTDPHCRPKATS